MLRYAWKNEDILKVPPFPELSYTRPEIEYITLEKQNTILSHIPERHRPIFQFMMEYGFITFIILKILYRISYEGF